MLKGLSSSTTNLDLSECLISNSGINEDNNEKELVNFKARVKTLGLMFLVVFSPIINPFY